MRPSSKSRRSVPQAPAPSRAIRGQNGPKYTARPTTGKYITNHRYEAVQIVNNDIDSSDVRAARNCTSLETKNKISEKKKTESVVRDFELFMKQNQIEKNKNEVLIRHYFMRWSTKYNQRIRLMPRKSSIIPVTETCTQNNKNKQLVEKREKLKKPRDLDEQSRKDKIAEAAKSFMAFYDRKPEATTKNVSKQNFSPTFHQESSKLPVRRSKLTKISPKVKENPKKESPIKQIIQSFSTDSDDEELIRFTNQVLARRRTAAGDLLAKTIDIPDEDDYNTASDKDQSKSESDSASDVFAEPINVVPKPHVRKFVPPESFDVSDSDDEELVPPKRSPPNPIQNSTIRSPKKFDVSDTDDEITEIIKSIRKTARGCRGEGSEFNDEKIEDDIPLSPQIVKKVANDSSEIGNISGTEIKSPPKASYPIGKKETKIEQRQNNKLTPPKNISPINSQKIEKQTPPIGTPKIVNNPQQRSPVPTIIPSDSESSDDEIKRAVKRAKERRSGVSSPSKPLISAIESDTSDEEIDMSIAGLTKIISVLTAPNKTEINMDEPAEEENFEASVSSDSSLDFLDRKSFGHNEIERSYPHTEKSMQEMYNDNGIDEQYTMDHERIRNSRLSKFDFDLSDLEEEEERKEMDKVSVIEKPHVSFDSINNSQKGRPKLSISGDSASFGLDLQNSLENENENDSMAFTITADTPAPKDEIVVDGLDESDDLHLLSSFSDDDGNGNDNKENNSDLESFVNMEIRAIASAIAQASDSESNPKSDSKSCSDKEEEDEKYIESKISQQLNNSDSSSSTDGIFAPPEIENLISKYESPSKKLLEISDDSSSPQAKIPQDDLKLDENDREESVHNDMESDQSSDLFVISNVPQTPPMAGKSESSPEKEERRIPTPKSDNVPNSENRNDFDQDFSLISSDNMKEKATAVKEEEEEEDDTEQFIASVRAGALKGVEIDEQDESNSEDELMSKIDEVANQFLQKSPLPSPRVNAAAASNENTEKVEKVSPKKYESDEDFFEKLENQLGDISTDESDSDIGDLEANYRELMNVSDSD